MLPPALELPSASSTSHERPDVDAELAEAMDGLSLPQTLLSVNATPASGWSMLGTLTPRRPGHERLYLLDRIDGLLIPGPAAPPPSPLLMPASKPPHVGLRTPWTGRAKGKRSFDVIDEDDQSRPASLETTPHLTSAPPPTPRGPEPPALFQLMERASRESEENWSD